MMSGHDGKARHPRQRGNQRWPDRMNVQYARPSYRSMNHPQNRMRDCFQTFPSWRPARRLDHILTSASLEVHDVHVLDHVLSDHLPIAMDIMLPEDLDIAA